MIGSGQFGSPWVRRQRANVRRPLIHCGTTAGGQLPVWAHCSSCCCSAVSPVFGIRCWQASWAAWYCEVLIPNCRASPLGTCPLRWGSGKFRTPWLRMQAEYATADAEVDDPRALGEDDADPPLATLGPAELRVQA